MFQHDFSTMTAKNQMRTLARYPDMFDARCIRHHEYGCVMETLLLAAYPSEAIAAYFGLPVKTIETYEGAFYDVRSRPATVTVDQLCIPKRERRPGFRPKDERFLKSVALTYGKKGLAMYMLCPEPSAETAATPATATPQEPLHDLGNAQ